MKGGNTWEDATPVAARDNEGAQTLRTSELPAPGTGASVSYTHHDLHHTHYSCHLTCFSACHAGCRPNAVATLLLISRKVKRYVGTLW